MMNNLSFPIKFVFHISTFSNDFTATDATGKTIAFVKQKLFKLKEDVSVFQNESKSKLLFNKKVARLKKEASFFGRKFEVTKLNDMDQDDEQRIILGFMMMILLERRRG